MAARKSTPPLEADTEQDLLDGEDDAAEQVADSGPTAMEAAYADALRRERGDYLRYGRKDRAADVASELKRLGAPLERAVPAPNETA